MLKVPTYSLVYSNKVLIYHSLFISNDMDCKSIIKKHKVQFSIVKYCKNVTIHSCLTAPYSEARLPAWNNEQAKDALITRIAVPLCV